MTTGYAVLNRVAMWGRYLGLVGIDEIVDKRNPEPQQFLAQPEDAELGISGSSMYGVSLPGFPALPRLHLSPPVIVQPYHLEIWVEKSEIEDIVLPLARSRS